VTIVTLSFSFMERGLYHPIEFSCEHMAVVETGDVETNVAREIDDIELRKRVGPYGYVQF
jgi:hypothetical protein